VCKGSGTVSIHQPCFFPWLGYLHKIACVDKFVLLDDVQFKKNNYINRVKIRNQVGELWLTVPVSSFSSTEKINNMRIHDKDKSLKKVVNNIKASYSGADYFKDYIDELENLIFSATDSLAELNKKTIIFLMDQFEIDTDLVISSSIDILKGNGPSDLNMDIVKHLNGERYLSGVHGKEYLEIDKFSRNGIAVDFQNYKVKPYEQLGSGFISGLSSLDVLFNLGPNSPSFFYDR
jgi:hypothetical protein